MLTELQQKVVDTPGNVIVMASAGTGKTHTLVCKMAKDIECKRGQSIAAITFTIKAAQEIRDRAKIDTFKHFIGTNNSFVLEEVIRPFMKDVFGEEFDLDFDTDYKKTFYCFNDGIKLAKKSIIGSYIKKLKKNFVFELANKIVKESEVCKLYLKSKYHKIYVDEYQDCDKEMHEFFMFLCDELEIETFIVGDEKQSIYTWRGTSPKFFKSISHKKNFQKIIMRENFRSTKQIQNYSNMLFEETRDQYKKDSSEGVIWIKTEGRPWADCVMGQIDTSKELVILRYTNERAEHCASTLTDNGCDCVFIPLVPVKEITTASAWIYGSLAEYCILNGQSVYDFISSMSWSSKKLGYKSKELKKKLDEIKNNINNPDVFEELVSIFVKDLGHSPEEWHISALYKTICDKKCHVALNPEKQMHASMTFHSSKGLEYDQVLIFAEDYDLATENGFYNHYVASTRAKSRLIVVETESSNAKDLMANLKRIYNRARVPMEDVLFFC